MMGVLTVCDGKFYNRESGYSVVFDDNGRVAYAYLLNQNEEIVGDVWLYNRCSTPLVPEWNDSEKAPFANPMDFVKNNSDFIPVENISEVHVGWELTRHGMIEAKIFIRNTLFAVIFDGAKPGYSLLASKSGPLAKVLE